VQLLSDPQTSGGLFAAIGPPAVAAAIDGLSRAGVDASVVGRVEAAGSWKIVVR
jgi:hypothetical protein